MTFWKCNF